MQSSIPKRWHIDESIYDAYKTVSDYEDIGPVYPSYETNAGIVYFDKTDGKSNIYFSPSIKASGFKDKDTNYFKIISANDSWGNAVEAWGIGDGISDDDAKRAAALITNVSPARGVSAGDIIRIGGVLYVARDNVGNKRTSWRKVGNRGGKGMTEGDPNSNYVNDAKGWLNNTLGSYRVEKADEYASGTYSTLFPHSALINELGTEGIVTPRGTITALPSHTGIVPADLTRNLYTLGELAPSMIKTFSLGQDVISQRSQTSEDNSMNINNLYATFETDDGFDFERLLVQARQYVATTKNNKH